MSRVKHVQIHLSEPARTDAANALHPIPSLAPPSLTTDPHDYYKQADTHALKYADEMQARREFTGPHFHGVTNVVCSEGTLDVYIDDMLYMYPMHTIARVKVYETAE